MEPELLYKGFIKVEKRRVDGAPREVVCATDSVAGLLYDATNNRVLLVSQKRAPMVREDNPDGYIVEAVAGRFDHKTNPKTLLVKEAWEEAGVTITEHDVVLLNDGRPVALSAGVLTERTYLAFGEIHPTKVAAGELFGNVDEGERVTRVWVPADDFVKGFHEDLRVLFFAQYLKNMLSA